LTDSAVSPLEQVLVQVAEPYCTEIMTSMVEATQNVHYAMFESVPAEKIPNISTLVFETIRKVCKDGFDMERMEDILSRQVRIID